MSSVRTRTAQKIREAISGKNITRDPDFESIFLECVETEELLRQVVTFSQYFQKTLPALAYFSEGLSSSVLKLYDKTTAHRGPALQISEVHKSCHAVYKETEEEFKGLMDHMSQWFKIFDDIRDVTKQRNKSRLIYDHYVQKTNSLKNSITKKRSKNSNYHETPKESERIARNERKMQSATNNFQSDTIKNTQLISQALEIKFSHLSPALAKIVSIEVALFKKVQKTVSTLKHIPEMLTKANKDRYTEQSMKRKSIEKQHYRENDTEEIPYEEQNPPPRMRMESQVEKQSSSDSYGDPELKAHRASMNSWENMAKKVNEKDDVWGIGNPNMFMGPNTGFQNAMPREEIRKSTGNEYSLPKKQFETETYRGFRDNRGNSREESRKSMGIEYSLPKKQFETEAIQGFRDTRGVSTDSFRFDFPAASVEESQFRNEAEGHTEFRIPQNRSSNERKSLKPQTDEYGFSIAASVKESSYDYQHKIQRISDDSGYQDSYEERDSFKQSESFKDLDRMKTPDPYSNISNIKAQMNSSPPINPVYMNTQGSLPVESFKTVPQDAAMGWNPAYQQYMQNMMNPQYLHQMQQNMMSYQNVMAVQSDNKDHFKGLGFVEEEQMRQQMEAQMKAKMSEQQKQQFQIQSKSKNPFKGNDLLDMM